MRDVLFIVNPRAASGRASRVWEDLRNRVRSLRTAMVVQCEERGTAAKAIIDALTPQIRRVVTVGGDGTLNHALNLMLADAPDIERSLGLIPVGTGSDLARGLGLETRPMQALEQALEALPSRMDALRLHAAGQHRYLINVASLGLSAPVAARVNALPKRNTATYLTAALRVLLSYQPQWARIHLDGKFWCQGRFYIVVVANGSCFAKGMRIAPKADPHDGLADVVAIEAASKPLVLAWLPSVYLGRHLAAPFVHWARAKTIDIDTGSEQPAFEGDGEVSLPAPGSLTVEQGAVLFSGLTNR